MEMREVREQSSDAGEERRVKDEEEGSRRWKRGQEEIDEVTEMEGGRKICYRHIPEDCGHSGDSCSMCLLDRVCVTAPVQGRFCWQDVDQLYACVCVCVRVEPRDSGGFTSDPSTPRQTSDKMRKEGEGRRESRINAEEAKRERKSEERGCKWGRKWSESKDDRRRRRSEGGGEKERSVQIRDERRKTRHECVKMLTERSRKRGIASERVQSGESDTADVQGGLSLSPRRSLRRSTSLPLRSPREADTSLHAFDPLTEGGMNRGVERGERAGKKRAAKGGWAADGHLNARPADLLEERERDTHTTLGRTHKHGCKRFEFGSEWRKASVRRNMKSTSKNVSLLSAPGTEVLACEVSRWPRDVTMQRWWCHGFRSGQGTLTVSRLLPYVSFSAFHRSKLHSLTVRKASSSDSRSKNNRNSRGVRIREAYATLDQLYRRAGTKGMTFFFFLCIAYNR